MYLNPLKEPQYNILDQAAAEIGPTIVPEQFKAALAAQGAFGWVQYSYNYVCLHCHMHLETLKIHSD